MKPPPLSFCSATGQRRKDDLGIRPRRLDRDAVVRQSPLLDAAVLLERIADLGEVSLDEPIVSKLVQDEFPAPTGCTADSPQVDDDLMPVRVLEQGVQDRPT